MKNKLQDLVLLYEETESKIRAELALLGGDECNCEDEEEINLVNTDNNELGVDRFCGICGGVIWDREL